MVNDERYQKSFDELRAILKRLLKDALCQKSIERLKLRAMNHPTLFVRINIFFSTEEKEHSAKEKEFGGEFNTFLSALEWLMVRNVNFNEVTNHLLTMRLRYEKFGWGLVAQTKPKPVALIVSPPPEEFELSEPDKVFMKAMTKIGVVRKKTDAST